MASESAGGANGEEVASAFVSIMADLNPLNAALSSLPALVLAPLTRTSEGVRNYLGNMLDSSLTAALRGQVGEMIAGIGQSAVRGIAGTLKGGLTAILGET